ncbi:type II toxin-antitoxin system RelE/ParE family toxin [Roseomonas aeriglobus]|nr:type II toxin-antitoxin system RelE/ParE family toxin [Roseomonas aeriglobus]
MDIFWSPPAEADLDRIAEWLDDHRGLEMSARVLEAIGQRTHFLADFPHGGRPLADGKRALLVLDTPYVIIYRLRDGLVEIVRVHHERENWQVRV